MKKGAFLAIIILSQIMISNILQAQEAPKKSEERASKMAQKMKSAMKLTDEQTLKAKEINIKAIESRRDIHQKYKQQMLADMKKIEEETDAQYLQILSKEQFETYKAMKEKR